MQQKPNLEIMSFIERDILPRYNAFGRSHGLQHVQHVIRNSLELVPLTGADVNMVYVIAAYHDLGMEGPRAIHHITSGKILQADARLRKWFSAEQIKKHQIKISNIGKKLDSYYELDTPEQMLEWLNKNEAQADLTDVSTLEVGMQREKFRRLEHQIYRSFNAPVVLYAFTQLCGYETSNIIHIIEGIRYGVDPSYIENNILIC